MGIARRFVMELFHELMTAAKGAKEVDDKRAKEMCDSLIESVSSEVGMLGRLKERFEALEDESPEAVMELDEFARVSR